MSATYTGLRRRSQAGRAALIILALLVLVVLGAALWYVTKGRVGGGESMTVAAARMAPQNTQVLFALDLNRVGMDAEAQKKLFQLWSGNSFEELKKEIKDQFGLALEEDILTWITGEGALIVAPKEGQKSLAQALDEGGGGKVPPVRMLLAMKVRDAKQAQASLEKMQAKVAEEEGITYKTEDFQGSTLHVAEPAGDGPTWTIHQDLLLVGLTVDDLKMGITGLSTKGSSLADNEKYKAAVGSLKKSDGVLGYVDIQGLLEGAPLGEMGSPDAEKLVSSLRYAVLGGGAEGKQATSEFILKIDPAAAGPLGEKVFNDKHNIQFDTAEFFSEQSDVFAAVNLRMIYDIVYDLMGAFPEAAGMRDLPQQQLAQQGVDFKADVLGTLTGEIGFSARNMGRLQALQIQQLGKGQAQDPQQVMREMQSLPFMITVGLTSQAAFNRLLEKPGAAAMMAAMPGTEFEGTTIRGTGDFAFAVTDKALVLGANGGKETVQTAVKSKKDGKGINALPGYKKVLDMAGAGGKAFLVMYQDSGRIYQQAAAEVKDQKELADLLTTVGQSTGRTWTASVMRKDGIYAVGLTDLEPAPAPAATSK